jgi:hypothetical protein
MINIAATAEDGHHDRVLAILEMCELAGATVRDANAFYLAGLSPRAVADQLAARFEKESPEFRALLSRFNQ